MNSLYYTHHDSLHTHRLICTDGILILLFLSLPIKAENIEYNASEFAGSKACAGCHETQATNWQSSDHSWSMRDATPTNVLGDFSGVQYKHMEEADFFYQRDNQFFVKTIGANGEMQEFQIKYTFGFEPLQQYLIAFDEGKLQALTTAWDSRPAEQGGQRWFSLYPNENIMHDNAFHWTGSYFNWNSRCADCHSTDLQKNYDPTKQRFDTSWQEINVSCESCHGPAKAHVIWAQSSSDEISNMGLNKNINPRLPWLRGENEATAHLPQKPIASIDGQLAVCGRCHSRRTVIDDATVVGNFHNAHQLELLREDLYYPDGQIQDEVYVLGSFLQSKMHDQGVTCSNCHEPHGLKLRAKGNALCSQCHNPQVFDTSEHHHHNQSSGSQCINCHMPTNTYMQVDPRRDHSFRIPRPDLSESLNTPNACNNCHTNKTTNWAAQEVSAWLKITNKTLPKHYGETFAKARQGNSGSLRELLDLANRESAPAIVRATALSLMIPSSVTAATLRTQLHADDPLLRIGAAKALASLPPNHRHADLLPLIYDPIKAVRMEAMRLLEDITETSIQEKDIKQYRIVLNEYTATMFKLSDTPEGKINLGNYYINKNKYGLAESWFKKAMTEKFLPAYLNLADLYRFLKQDKKGKPILHAAIALEPDQATPYHALALLLIRENDYSEAEKMLSKAIHLEPNNREYGYIYAVLLDSRGRHQDAINQLKKLHEILPNDLQIITTLIEVSRHAGNNLEALKYAKIAEKSHPNNNYLKNIIHSLERQSPFLTK